MRYYKYTGVDIRSLYVYYCISSFQLICMSYMTLWTCAEVIHTLITHTHLMVMTCVLYSQILCITVIISRGELLCINFSMYY